MAIAPTLPFVLYGAQGAPILGITGDSNTYKPEGPYTNFQNCKHTLTLAGNFSGGTASSFITLDESLAPSSWVALPFPDQKNAHTMSTAGAFSFDAHFFAFKLNFTTGGAGLPSILALIS